jgi:hypothetical protein
MMALNRPRSFMDELYFLFVARKAPVWNSTRFMLAPSGLFVVGSAVARMPKYAAIRNRQDRAASKANKKGRLVSIINSGLFLWTLTALLLTVGGSYFTKVQQCIVQSERVLERFTRLNNEIANRRNFIEELVNSSSQHSEIQSGLARLPTTYPEFKELSLLELVLEQNKITRSITFHDMMNRFAEVLAKDLKPVPGLYYARYGK